MPETPIRQSSILRWLTVGVAAYGGWTLANLLATLSLPLLFLLDRFYKGSNGSLSRKLLCAGVGFYVFRYLNWVGVQCVVEQPSRKELLEGGPYIFVSNHRSWFDALFILGLMPGVRLPVKAAYMNVPGLGWLARSVGVIPVDKTSAQSAIGCFSEAKEALQLGDSLSVYPETTRRRFGRVRPFADMFFRLATDTGLPVRPLLIHSDLPCLGPGTDSFLPYKKAIWRIRVLDAIYPDSKERAVDLSQRVHKIVAKEIGLLDEATEKERRE